MRAFFLLLLLAGCDPVLLQGAGRASAAAADGRPPVVYAFDPTTGEPLFADEMDLRLRTISGIDSSETSSPTGGPIVMQLVAIVLIPGISFLSRPAGFDLDHDNGREFGFKEFSLSVIRLEIQESVADDTFQLVHALDFGSVSTSAYDFGDADEDGLGEMTISQTTNFSDFFLRVYESTSPTTYPTELVWEASTGGSTSLADFADTDGDGVQEIVVVGRPTSVEDIHVRIFENEGDNSFGQTFAQAFPELGLGQSAEVMDDLDGDGHAEILLGGTVLGGFKLIAVESIGNDAYEAIWSAELAHNVGFIVDAGDLDGDGGREFLVGGLKPGAPFLLVVQVFEAIADNDFQVVATFTQPFGTLEGEAIAAVADVDGDGGREIVFGSGTTLRVYQNTGDDAWNRIWINTMGALQAMGAGDNDADGKEELIVSEGGFDGFTGIWEIDPADAADMDGDDVVDVIDNCPLTANPDQEDADSDGVGDLCDNCLHGPNPTQGPAPLGQGIVASDPQTFSWPLAADVVYVRGDLAGVGSYAFDTLDSLALAQSLTDASMPANDSGFFYLLRPDCVVGSWQTAIGAEPERDAALP